MNLESLIKEKIGYTNDRHDSCNDCQHCTVVHGSIGDSPVYKCTVANVVAFTVSPDATCEMFKFKSIK